MIKRILVLGLMTLFTLTSFSETKPIVKKDTDSLTKTQIYNDFKSVYNEDFKTIIENGVDLGKWTVGRVDTIVSHGVRVINNAAVHTYNILKTQQLVKSIHHTFYWLVSLVLLVVISIRLKNYLKDPQETQGTILVVLAIMDVLLFAYNGANFMEMWTGYLNPEYGAIKEIIEFTNK